MKQHAQIFIDGVGAGEKHEQRFFPNAETLHFLPEFSMVGVMLQAVVEGFESLPLLPGGKAGPAQIQIEDGIDDSRGAGIIGLEQDKSFSARRDSALMLLVDNSLEPAAI